MNAVNRYKLQSHDRLKLRKDIETLFQSGEAFSVFPFRVVYLSVNDPSDKRLIKFGISVPKKKINKAVSRNLIKRRVREAWRLHKNLIDCNYLDNKRLHCFLIYIGKKEIPKYKLIEDTIAQIISKLNQTIATK